MDSPAERVRHPSDLVNIILCSLGIALILLMAVYAHATTQGVGQDVQGFDKILKRVLFLQVQAIETLIIVFIPVSVLIELGVRRLGRQIIEAIVAAVLGFTLGLVALWLLEEFAGEDIIGSLSAYRSGTFQLTVPTYVAALGGLLTAAGERARRRTVAWSWNFLFVGLGVAVVTAQASLLGVLIALLIGRIAGLAVRYTSGVHSDRAYGFDLISAVRRAGFSPTALVRVRDITDEAPATPDFMVGVTADGVTIPSPPTTATTVPASGHSALRHHKTQTTVAVGSTAAAKTAAKTAAAADSAVAADSAAVALARAGDNRVYALYTADGRRRDVVVLDGDRQVVGFLTRWWRSLRLRGIERRGAISLRSVAERTALLSYAAEAAHVHTPKLVGIGEAADSLVLVSEHAAGAVSLRDLPEEQLTDAVLAAIWHQLGLAHKAGLAHRDLTSDVVLVAQGASVTVTGQAVSVTPPQVWLTGWDQGDIASSSLVRRMDLTQMVALLALRVGAERAVASAVTALTKDDIAAIGPLLQSVVLPSSTREEMRRNKNLLKELRAALVDQLPEVSIEPERITRFGARTVITVMLAVAAVTVLITTLNINQIVAAVKEANPWWALGSFAFGLLTWVGAGLTLAAFSSVKLPLWRAMLAQVAGSYVALAAPAGIGPAALNLRLLTKRGVSTPMAVATVALVQLSQFVSTLILLVVLMIFSGEGGLIKPPSRTVLLAIAIVAVLVVAVLLVPQIRTWLISKVRPMIEQVWPRLSEMLSHPGRLAVGIAGNILVTMGYVLAFEAALYALGQVHLNLIDAAIIYLLGNTAGALVPTPGGVGTIELSLSTGLNRTAGIAPALAFSAAVLFRVTTYWIRIPIGLVAMRYLQRKGEL